jgi:hypothetical protein
MFAKGKTAIDGLSGNESAAALDLIGAVISGVARACTCSTSGRKR